MTPKSRDACYPARKVVFCAPNSGPLVAYPDPKAIS